MARHFNGFMEGGPPSWSEERSYTKGRTGNNMGHREQNENWATDGVDEEGRMQADVAAAPSLMQTDAAAAPSLRPSDGADAGILENRQPPTGETSPQISPNFGDVTQEAVRLSSYRNFPDSVPVSASRMARAGFYFSGTGDRVVCFSCGGGVEGWEFGDTAMGEHERLYPHCDFVNGRETRNKPLLPPPGLFPASVPQAAAAAAPPPGRDYTDFLSPAQQDKLRRKEADLNDNNDNSYRQPPSAGARATTNLGRADNNNSAQGRDRADCMPTGARQGFVTKNVNHLLPNANTSYDVTDPGPGTPQVQERDIDPREQYKSEQRRLDSYITWPAWAPIQPRELAKAGFFYTGSDDRVQCFCCQGILRNWEAGDRAMNEHRRHFSSCPFVLNFNVGNIPIEDQDPNLPPSVQQSVPSSPPASQSSGLYQTARLHQPGLQVPVYRASRPKHPQMADEQIRLSSFHLWPSSTAVAAQHLAKAGFFYTMVADNVKCFYCDGGLRNWEPGDEPWTEHAKWFPRCEFLLQQRGDDYVQGVQARFPNLHAQQQVQILQQHMRPPDEAGTGRPAPRPQTSQSSLAVEMQSQVVSGVLEMGFDPNIVRNAVQQHLREHGSGFTSAHELVVAVLDLEEEEERMEHSGSSQMGKGAGPGEGASQKLKELEQPAATTTTSASAAAAGASGTEEPQPGTSAPMEEPAAAASGEGNSLEQLQKELDKYKDERTCKICMDAEVNIVFIPCGHLAVCANCAASVRRCPICRASIRGTVRTYMS